MTSSQFSDTFHSYYGVPPGYEGASTFAVLAVLCAAIEAAGTLEKTAVAQKLRELQLREFYADFRYDKDGMIDSEPIVVQIPGGSSRQTDREGDDVIVWPLEYASQELEFPMPSWEVRRCFQTCDETCNLDTGECECPPGFVRLSTDGQCERPLDSGLSVAMIAGLAAGVVALMLVAAFVYRRNRNRGNHLLRLRSTGAPPILHMKAGHSYHLFLSHV